MGHPDQLTLTGELKDVNKMDVLKDAYRRLEEGYGQVDLNRLFKSDPKREQLVKNYWTKREPSGEGQGQKEKVSAFLVLLLPYQKVQRQHILKDNG